MRTKVLAPCVLCALVLLGPAACGGGSGDGEVPSGPIVDQSHYPMPLPAKNQLAGAVDLAQTFTVGVSGRLARVVLALAHASDGEILLQVRPVSGGFPAADGADALASVTLVTQTDLGATPGPFTWELGAQAFDVVAGEVYAICLVGGGGVCTWSESQSDEYPGGTAFWRLHAEPETGWSQSPIYDFVFQTWIEP